MKVNEIKKNEKVVSNNTFSLIVAMVKHKRNLPLDFKVTKNIVMKQIARERTILEAHQQQKGGHSSPLLCMSKFCQALTSTQIKDLVNSCIHNTKYQQKIIE